MPRARKEGDPVLAGSINQDAALRVRVEKPAGETLIARVVRLVEEAAESKAPSERFIDRFARVYMPAVCLVALLTAVGPPLVAGEPWETWIYRGLALLLIGCPCALIISTPATIASALAAGARHGLLVKGGAAMERIGTVRHIAFDKTGTLTEGKPQVTDVQPFGGADAGEVLALAAAVSADSSHPLSVAILTYARAKDVPVSQVRGSEAIAGKGIRGRVGDRQVVVGAAARLGLDAATVARSAALEGEGKSVSAVVVDGEPIGLIAFRDEPRADAHAALAAIRAMRVQILMLTGDNRASGEAVGKTLGIEARTDLLPEDKLAEVRDLAGQGGVAVVGDGINDAPALAAATVGIAMGSGTDVALEAGDAAILRDRIFDVAGLVRLSRRSMQVVRQNVTIALGLKAVFLVTTVLGFTGLWIAVLADTGATVIVTANAMRLLGWRNEAA
jgi:Cd2+/Zn2+-exporting ATPase